MDSDGPIDPWLAAQKPWAKRFAQRRLAQKWKEAAKRLAVALEEFLEAVKDITKPKDQEGQQENGKE